LNFDPKAAGEKRKLQLQELEEMRLSAYESSKLYKERMKAYHDNKILKREFYPSQFVLLFNSRLRLFPRKLKSKWSGPFLVKHVKPYGAIELEDPESKRSWVVNGQRLKPYFGGEMIGSPQSFNWTNLNETGIRLVTLNKRFLGGNPLF